MWNTDSIYPLYISGPGNRFFTGLIDEPQVFDRALSASEIHAIYAAASAGQCKPASFAVFSGSNQTATIGHTLANPIVANITDSGGNPVVGSAVTFTATSGNGTVNGSGSAVVVTDANGNASANWTVGATAGTQTVQATTPAFSYSISLTATAVGALAAVGGTGQTGGVGTALATPFTVTATGAGGVPIPGVTVSFAMASGGGTLSVASATTNASGQASTTLTLGSTPGTNTVTATAVGLTGSPVMFSATGQALYALTATPSPVAFGNVSLTATARQTVTFTSTGLNALVVSGISASGAGFSLQNLPAFPLTVAPNATATFDVIFAPTTAANYTGSVTISSNAGAGPMSVALTGTGNPLSAMTVSPDRTVYAGGQAINVLGGVTAPNGTGVANVPVIVTWTIGGATYSQSTTTSATGGYAASYSPQPGDAGVVQVQATASSGGASISASKTVRLLGLQVSPTVASVDQLMGSAQNVQLGLGNLGDAALGALNVSVSGNGVAGVTGSLSLAGVPTSLNPGGSAGFNLVVTAAAGTAPASAAVFTITASGLDATSGTKDQRVATVTVRLHTASAAPVLSPSAASLGVSPGAKASQQFSVRNDGYLPLTGAVVTLDTPAATPWVTVANGTLGNLTTGQSQTFQIEANPPAGQAVAAYAVPIHLASPGVNGPGNSIAATVVVNVTAGTTGTAYFQVNNDIQQVVAGATVLLVPKTAYTGGATAQYTGATAADGSVTINGVPAGDYYYTVAATGHDPGVGSVRVTAGGGAQLLPSLRQAAEMLAKAKSGGMKPMAAAGAPSPVIVTLTFQVVTLSYVLTPTTIGDQYTVTIHVKYSETVPKPALVPDPAWLDLSGCAGTASTRTLTITNGHPTIGVRNVVVDASQIDAGTTNGQKLTIVFGGPMCNGSSTCNVGTVAAKQSVQIPYTVTTGANLASRGLGSINISGDYDFAQSNGSVAVQTTGSSITASYRGAPDVYTGSIDFLHDASVGSNNLQYLDGSFVHTVSNCRAYAGTFLHPIDQVMGGQQLVAYARRKTDSTEFASVYDSTNVVFWHTSFQPAKAGFTGSGDSSSFRIDTPDSNGRTLSDAVKKLLYSDQTVSQGTPLYVDLVVSWPDGIKAYSVPISIGTPPGPDWIPPIPPTVPCFGNCGSGSGIPGLPPVLPPGPPSPTPPTCTVCDWYFPQTLGLERQAFNGTVGIAPAVPISNVHASVNLLDAAGNDASSQFTLVLGSDQFGATSGGTLSAPAKVYWQIIPKAGAGGSNSQGTQYKSQATFSYTLSGQTYTLVTNAITFTVLPQPHLTVQYTVPRLIVDGKPAKLRVHVQDVGLGQANNFTVSAAQPYVRGEDGAPNNVWITGSSNTANGSAFTANQLDVNFGVIAGGGGTADGYWSVQTDRRGFLIDMEALYWQHTLYTLNNTQTNLDALVDAPTVAFVGALGGKLTGTGLLSGLTVAAMQGSTVVGQDTTDGSGNYFIPDLPVGVYTLAVTMPTGQNLATRSNINVLGDQPTPFQDIAVVVPSAGPVPVTVNTSPSGLTVTVDGVAYTAPHSFTWNAGTAHTLAAASVQGNAQTQNVFGTWSQGGAASQTVTVPAGGANYTANYTTQYNLATAVSPAGAGTITAGGWVNAGTTLSISASANLGYQFAGFSGALTGTTSPQNLTMSGPAVVTANFSPIAPLLSAAITARTGTLAARSWTITLSNSGLGIGVGTQITGIAITQTAGTACAVPVVSGLPLSVGTVNPLATGAATAVVNFGSCSATARYTVKISFSANGGSYTGSTTLNNQFY